MSSDDGWPRMTLRAAGVSLIDCDHQTPPATEVGYPYIAIPQLKDGRRCNSGDSALIPPGLECAIGQNLVVLRSDGSVVDPKLLRWLLRGPDWWDQVSKYINVGAVFDSLRCRDIPHFELPVPPRAEQAAIAELLDALVNRIAILRETNATLEAIAQALFKSWFVDFDPVRAKSQGLAPAGMDEATAALFSDSFDESAFGLVPKGWEMGAVGDVAEIVKGKSYSSKDLVPEHDTALVTLKSFERGGGFRLDGFKPYSGSYKPAQVVLPGDLIVAYTDVTQAAELIGKPAVVVGVAEHTTLVASLDVGIVRPIERRSTRQFLYGLFRTEAFQAHTLARTSGTTVLHLSKDAVGSYGFARPPTELISVFTCVAESLACRRQVNVDQMRNLATLRDTLLPRLISGQLRLPEALVELEEAA